MRIIFFNIWHGELWDKLQKFLEQQAAGTDIFCFMEVNPEVQDKLRSVLSGYGNIYFKGHKIDHNGGVFQGISVFVSDKLKIIDSFTDNLFKPIHNDAGGLLAVEFEIEGKRFFVGSVHGKAQPGEKLDTPERLEQSKRIIELFEDKKGPRIIGGDFNLYPDTKSVSMFEEAGYRNLIREFNIKSTRNKISWEHFKNVQYYADYCFTSPDVKVITFEVPNVEVSDHEPQILDFEI